MVLGILKELCSNGALVSLLGPLPDQKHSIHHLLHNLEQQAKIMINRIGKPPLLQCIFFKGEDSYPEKYGDFDPAASKTHESKNIFFLQFSSKLCLVKTTKNGVC